jgi:hypothetical protein
MGLEKYNARILHDPSGVFRRGAEISWYEFAEMVRSGELPEGTRVEKVAQNSRFRVSTTQSRGNNCIIDEDGREWTAVKNKFNNNGLQFRQKSNNRRGR